MSKTEFLGLGLTAESETKTVFKDWRMQMNGVGNGSNMELIDAACKRLNLSVEELMVRMDPDALAQALFSSELYQASLDERLGYRMEIVSTSDVLSIEVPSTTLSVRVWHGSNNITNSIDASLFRWHRTTNDPVADQRWDEEHKGIKSFTVTTLDVFYSATYTCELDDSALDTEGE